MDFHLLAEPLRWLPPQLLPYLIILANCLLFGLLRSLANHLLQPLEETRANCNGSSSSRQRNKPDGQTNRRWMGKLGRLFVGELISTCELCADCAELNVVYELHGSVAYGLALSLLSYVWMGTFGDAQTSPAYLVESYAMSDAKGLLRSADTWARLLGQTLAMPLAWRLASLYWRQRLLAAHMQLLLVDECKSSLGTSTTNGFLIEAICCLICRLLELVGEQLVERGKLSARAVKVTSALLSSLLVVLALDLSGGYFNPVLAASLEFGCGGANMYQHVLVFWLGPFAGHLGARLLHARLLGAGVPAEGAASGKSATHRQADERQTPGKAVGWERRTRGGRRRANQKAD